jgi:hypothetical protein
VVFRNTLDGLPSEGLSLRETFPENARGSAR